MFPSLFSPSFLLIAFVLPSPVATFSFTPGTPSQCDNLPISWTGGTPPFQLLLTPVFGTPQNISIPPSAYKSGVGSFSTQLQMAENTQVLLTMSDASGFNSGGTTPLLTVGASEGGSSCNTTNPSTAFFFELNSALTQCRPFDFTGYTGAVQPVTILGFIPGGTAFQLNPSLGSTSFSWNADVLHGTSMIFSMIDAQGRQGGSSDIRSVGVSDDSSCLDNQSPSSTPAAPSPSSTSSSSSSGPTAPPTTAPPHGISIAAIAGTVIGALLFLAVVITLGLFCLRRKHDSRPSGNIRRLSRPMESEIDLNYDPHQAPVVTPYNVPQNSNPLLAPHPYHPNANPPFDANPFQDVSPPPVNRYQMPSQYQPPGALHPPSDYHYPPENSVSDPFHSPGPSLTGTEFDPISQTAPGQLMSRDSTLTSQRKAGLTGATAYKPSRFVVHIDADDDLPQPNDDGVVELPPQYSERRLVLGVANPTLDSDVGHPPGKS